MSEAWLALLFLATYGGFAWRAVGRPALMQARAEARKRKIDRFTTTPIAQGQVGALVKIAGRVEAVDALIEAPLTAGVGVAALTLVAIREQRRDGKESTTFIRDERVSDFIVRDDSGTALVRGRRAGLVTIPRAQLTPDADRQRRWLRRWHARAPILWLKRPLLFFECVLAPGAEVVVLGKCVERSGIAGEGPYREQTEPAITIDAPERGCVIVDW